MKPAAQLRAVKALINKPKKWTKGAFARGSDGCSSRLDEAVCFCILGAVDRSAAEPVIAEAFIRKLIPEQFHGEISAYNDDPGTTHADVMKLLDDAIALAEAEDA